MPSARNWLLADCTDSDQCNQPAIIWLAQLVGSLPASHYCKPTVCSFVLSRMPANVKNIDVAISSLAASLA